VVALVHLALAQEGPGPARVATGFAPEANPIVQVVVGTTETEFEQDPFEPTRLRRSTARVKTLLYIRADGTVDTKQVQ